MKTDIRMCGNCKNWKYNEEEEFRFCGCENSVFYGTPTDDFDFCMVNDGFEPIRRDRDE